MQDMLVFMKLENMFGVWPNLLSGSDEVSNTLVEERPHLEVTDDDELRISLSVQGDLSIGGAMGRTDWVFWSETDSANIYQDCLINEIVSESFN